MIQTWADENGERARPSDPTIAKSSGLVRSTIANHVKKLHDSGWLSIRSNRGRTHSNTYTLTIPAVYEVLIEQTLGEENVRRDGPYEEENIQQCPGPPCSNPRPGPIQAQPDLNPGSGALLGPRSRSLVAGSRACGDRLFEGEEAVLHVIERIVAPLGLRVDATSPWVDGVRATRNE
jgi:hypothetical protein